MGAYRFDQTGWPVVIIHAEGDLTKAQEDEHFREYRKLLDRKVDYALIFEASKIGNPSPAFRKAYADFMKTNASDFHRYCKGTAFVLTNNIIRGMFKALLWIMGDLPFPYTVVETLAEAQQWAKAKAMGH